MVLKMPWKAQKRDLRLLHLLDLLKPIFFDDVSVILLSKLLCANWCKVLSLNFQGRSGVRPIESKIILKMKGFPKG